MTLQYTQLGFRYSYEIPDPTKQFVVDFCKQHGLPVQEATWQAACKSKQFMHCLTEQYHEEALQAMHDDPVRSAAYFKYLGELAKGL